MARNQIKILVVEDNKADFRYIEIYLSDRGRYDLIHVESLYDAVETANNTEIGFVLLDLTLPDCSGFKTLTNFTERVNKEYPIIIMTGLNNEIVGTQSIKSGAQDYLIKGQFDQKTLVRSIRYSAQRFKEKQDLKQSLNVFKQNQRRYLEAQQMANFGSFELDIVSNSMTWTDEVFRILHLTPQLFEPTLKEYLNYVHFEDKNRVEEAFDEVLKTGKSIVFEHKIIVDGRTVKYLIVKLAANIDKETSKIVVFGVVQDITERKVNQKLTVEKNISEENNKNREEMMKTVGFHLRTPMASIVNLLYLLEQEPSSSIQKEYVDGLKTSVYDLSLMVNNILNYAVIISDDIQLEEEEVDLPDFINSMSRLIQIKIFNSNIKGNIDVQENLPVRSIADIRKVAQALLNVVEMLLVKPSPTSELKITVLSTPVNETNHTFELNFKVVMAGFGFSDNEMQNIHNSEKVLQENQNVPAYVRNVGISKMLTKALSGDINFKNKANHKFECSLTFPIKAKQVVPQRGGILPAKDIKVLLVEDHFLNQLGTKRILQKWSENVTVDIAENGEVGLEKFREYNYDLILMDLQMPIMNGFDCTQHIRKISEVPIIALTASASKHEQDKCVEIGMNNYISKPFKPETLYDAIMEVITVGTVTDGSAR